MRPAYLLTSIVLIFLLSTLLIAATNVAGKKSGGSGGGGGSRGNHDHVGGRDNEGQQNRGQAKAIVAVVHMQVVTIVNSVRVTEPIPDVLVVAPPPLPTSPLMTLSTILETYGLGAIGIGMGVGATYLTISGPASSYQLKQASKRTEDDLLSTIPEGYAVLLLSPPSDERDLLIRSIVKSAVVAGRPTFYLSNDVDSARELAARYQKCFHAFCTRSTEIGGPNLQTFNRGIESLTDINIITTNVVHENIGSINTDKIMIIDVLSDVLLYHKSLDTRKWLGDFIPKRKAQGFTILATLNPLITTQQEIQGVIDLFNGVIEIVEKQVTDKPRRFLVVRRMAGQRYSGNELLLDRDKMLESVYGIESLIMPLQRVADYK